MSTPPVALHRWRHSYCRCVCCCDVCSWLPRCPEAHRPCFFVQARNVAQALERCGVDAVIPTSGSAHPHPSVLSAVSQAPAPALSLLRRLPAYQRLQSWMKLRVASVLGRVPAQATTGGSLAFAAALHVRSALRCGRLHPSLAAEPDAQPCACSSLLVVGGLGNAHALSSSAGEKPSVPPAVASQQRLFDIVAV